LVYLGTRVPNYLEKNLSLLASQFPDNSVVLLSDSASEIERLTAEIKQVQFFEVSNPELTWVETLKHSNYSTDFRENFWTKTLARYYSIFEYMQTKPDQPILHIEADIWLSPNFPMGKFSDIGESIAYPLTNFDQGVASTVYFKDFHAAKLLKEFSEECMLGDPATTDVSVLGELYAKYPKEILILPTAASATSDFHEFVTPATRLKMSENYGRFCGVFDASTWGQFLTGEDPRNNVGRKLVYHHQLHHSVCPKMARFNFSKESGLTATFNNKQFEIFSLHIHSKNSQILDLSNDYNELRRYCMNYDGRELVEFSISTFLKQIFPYLKYRLRRIAKKILRGDS
jgi:hypothetical protein